MLRHRLQGVAARLVAWWSGRLPNCIFKILVVSALFRAFGESVFEWFVLHQREASRTILSKYWMPLKTFTLEQAESLRKLGTRLSDAPGSTEKIGDDCHETREKTIIDACRQPRQQSCSLHTCEKLLQLNSKHVNSLRTARQTLKAITMSYPERQPLGRAAASLSLTLFYFLEIFDSKDASDYSNPLEELGNPRITTT